MLRPTIIISDHTRQQLRRSLSSPAGNGALSLPAFASPSPCFTHFHCSLTHTLRTRPPHTLRTRSAHAPTRPALAPLHPTHHSTSAGLYPPTLAALAQGDARKETNAARLANTVTLKEKEALGLQLEQLEQTLELGEVQRRDLDRSQAELRAKLRASLEQERVHEAAMYEMRAAMQTARGRTGRRPSSRGTRWRPSCPS